MSRQLLAALLAAVTLSSTACFPSTRVVKNPDDNDCGIRYYRPKPYLLVKPMTNKSGEPVSGYVTLDQATMPDFSEEYSIHVRSGLGSNATSVELADGWRLEKLNVNTDSRFDDNLGAIADLVEAVPKATSGMRGDSSMSVRATNVPIGYYEAVITRGGDGKKRLYGFRYVGFLPFSACPIDACGAEPASCHDGQLYGLVMENDAMVFRALHEVPHMANLTRFDVNATHPSNLIEDLPEGYEEDRRGGGEVLDEAQQGNFPWKSLLPSA